MKRVVLLLACLMAAQPGVQAGELYRWLDSSGKVHYGDMPPAGPQQVEAIEMPAAPTPDFELPYETRRAQQNFPVTLYVAGNCVEQCKLARSLLTNRGIPFSEKTLKSKEEIEAFKQLSGSTLAPTLELGSTFLKGFQAEQWDSELDAAGYPKAPVASTVAP